MDKTPNATMIGASGCIPDHHVNFFGRLRKPAGPYRSAKASLESEPQVDMDIQTFETPELSPTAIHVPAPDPIAKVFNENQKFIRGLSLGNVETYLAIVQEVSAQVRQSRRNSYAEQPQRHNLPEHHQAEPQDQNQIKRGGQHQEQHPDHFQKQHQTESKSQRLENQTAQHESQHQHQPPRRPQSLANHPTHRFVITHYNKQDQKVPRQSRLQREENAMYCIEYYAEDGEMHGEESRWLDALLMPNFAGDPRGRYGFDRVRVCE